MTVEELIEELRLMPPTAIVFVSVPEVDRKDWYELIDQSIESVIYNFGQVSIRIEE